jgi:hypothetical protein
VAVDISRYFDRGMPKLFAYVLERCALLDQQAPEGMPQVVQTNPAQACFLENRKEVPLLEIVRVERPALW